MKTIRVLNEKDANRMMRCLNDCENMRYLFLGERSYSLDECLNFIKKSQLDKKSLHFAIVDESDNWIGTISLKNIESDVKKAEFAIITDSAVHGKGYAKKAVRELLEYAFFSIGLNRVYLNVITDNTPAIKFYLKCGFKYEGTFRQAVLLKNELFDLSWFSILKNEFAMS